MSAVFADLGVALPDLWTGSVTAVGVPVAPVFLSQAQLAALAPDMAARMLGLVGFGAARAGDALAGIAQAQLPMQQFGPEPLVECWLSAEQVQRASRENLQFAWNSQVLFGIVRQSVCADEYLEHQTRLAYLAMLDLLREKNFPHLVRVWNHFPGINADEDGMERYRRFCIGRHEALLAREYLQASEMPAASAVGSADGDLWLYFLAAHHPTQHVENPRQISAYRYPPQYGRRSPSFARATLMDWGSEWQLYISGTASIVGHETCWPGDVVGQLDETLANMQAVLVQADTLASGCRLQDLSLLKVYVRDPAHVDVIRAALGERLGGFLPTMYLQGDICRQDLLLEIEGVLRVPGGS